MEIASKENEKQKIRVSRGIVIEVNDAGETITMNVEDHMFLDRFCNLLDELQKVADELDSEETKKMELRDRVSIMIDKTRLLMSHIDNMFGKECCRKVFGDTVPGPYLIADFFDQLQPIAEKYMDKRQKEISKKYSRSRRGSRHV